MAMSLTPGSSSAPAAYPPEHVPAAGPVILAPNHFSFMDHFFLGVALRRKVQFMAKSQLFKPPMQGSTPTAACSRCGAATPTRRRS